MYNGDEFRINTFKNFHNFSKSSWMDYGTYNQSVNTEVNKINKDFEDEDEDEDEDDLDNNSENEYQDTNYEDGLVIGGSESTIKKGPSYPAGFSTIPDPNTPQTRGLAAKVGSTSNILTYEKFINTL